MTVFVRLLVFFLFLSSLASGPFSTAQAGPQCASRVLETTGAPRVLLSSADAALTIHEQREPLALRDLDDLISNLKSESRRFGRALDTQTAAVEIVKLKSPARTYLALFNKTRFMNACLDRATQFHETRKVLRTDDEILRRKRLVSIGGHDLTGEQLKEFYEQFVDSPAAIGIEREFWRDFLFPRLKAEPDLILIAVDVQDDDEKYISHEVLHAKYFRDSRYAALVKSFWENRVTEKDKTAIKRKLSDTYDPENEELMANEFQAYILQTRAREQVLGRWVSRYKGPFLRFLFSQGGFPGSLVP